MRKNLGGQNEKYFENISLLLGNSELFLTKKLLSLFTRSKRSYLEVNSVTAASDAQLSLHGKRLALDTDGLSLGQHLGPALVLVAHVTAAFGVSDFKMCTVSENKN